MPDKIKLRVTATRIFASICLSLPLFCQASDYIEGKDIPADLRPLIMPGTKLLAFVAADLNGDDKSDYVYILEKQPSHAGDAPVDTSQRPLHIAIRQADGKLKLVKSNEKIVFCSTCGGVFGDPFADLTAGKKSFAVSHYGGSAWRWANTYQFNYSKKDDTWQLVMVSESSFHATQPDKGKEKTYKPPKHFGKIDIADFDPEKFKGVGAK